MFDGIAEAFRQYQAELAEQEQAAPNHNPTGFGPNAKAEKTEKKVATKKRIEQNFPKRE